MAFYLGGVISHWGSGGLLGEGVNRFLRDIASPNAYTSLHLIQITNIPKMSYSLLKGGLYRGLFGGY